MNPAARGALLGLCAFALYATHDAVVKALGGGYSPFQIVFFSVLLSFPLATVMLMRDGTESHLRPVHPWWMGFRTAASVVTAACAFYAFTTLPLAQVYAILFAQPLVITLLAIPMLSERVGFRRGAAVVVGLAGVVIVLRPWGGTEFAPGHLAALGAAVLGGFASVVVRKIGPDERPLVLLLYPMVANFVVMGAAMPFVYRPMSGGDFGLVALVAALGFVATLLVITAYRLAPAGVVAPMQYSQIVWASIFGALFFGERLDGPTVAGALVVIASGLYILFRESRTAGSKRPTLNTRTRIGTPGTPRVSGFVPPAIPRREGVPPSGTEHVGLRGMPGRSSPASDAFRPGRAG